MIVNPLNPIKKKILFSVEYLDLIKDLNLVILMYQGAFISMALLL